MSRRSRVSYFQNVFELLGVVRTEERPESISLITAWEDQTHCVFPAAMREFYTTAATLILEDEQRSEWVLTLPELWSEYSNDELAYPTREVLEHTDQPERVREAVEPGPYFHVISENQGNWLMYLRADGGDDPLVYVTDGGPGFLDPSATHHANLSWCCAGRFTDVIFDWFRFYYCETDFVPLSYNFHHEHIFDDVNPPAKANANGLWFRTPAEPFHPPVVDFLTEHFGEPERVPRPGDVTTYTFNPSGCTVRLTADDPSMPGALSAWWVRAENPDQLASLGRLLAPWGTLRETLRADTDLAKGILRAVL